MKKTLVALLVLASAALLASADKGGGGDLKPLNMKCPVMTDEDVDPSVFVDYQGKRIWFCCDDCVQKFKASPETWLANLPQFHPEAPVVSKPSHPLGSLHPIAVHFPIALTMVGAFAAVLASLRGSVFFRNAAAYTILFAAAMVGPAYLLGEEAEDAKGKMAAALEQRVESHSDFAFFALCAVLAAGAFQALTLFVPNSKALRILALVAVLGAAGIIGYTAYLGGEIVRPGHLKPLLPF